MHRLSSIAVVLLSLGSAAGPLAAQTVLSDEAPAPFNYGTQFTSHVFNGSSGFRIDVPQDAAGLLVKVIAERAESTLAFYLRRGADVAVVGTVLADISVTESSDGGRVWTLDAQTLAAGTYYLAIVAGPYQEPLRGTVYADVLRDAAAPAAEFDVPGSTQILLAGQRAGTAMGTTASAPQNSPVVAQVTLASGQRVRFVANGTTDSSLWGKGIPPEGQSTNESLSAQFGLSGMNGPREALVGVFLGTTIDAMATPPDLQFQAGGAGEAIVAPLLQQTFYIGNGFTASGRPREFVAPQGATRLFVGSKSLIPRDNSGRYHVRVFTGAVEPPPVSANPLVVPGIAHLALAGQPDGATLGSNAAPFDSPGRVAIAVDAGQRLQFTVRGAVHLSTGAVVPPTGSFALVSAGLANGFSGLVAPEGSLVGVFTADTVDSRATTVRLYFDANLRAQPTLQPLLQQMFYVGDGTTAAGERRTVVAPEGATRLYLGVQDTNTYVNSGAFLAVVSVDDDGAPSLPDNGALNGASFAEGAVAPGEIVSVFGQNLAADTVVNSAVPLPTELGGVQVFFDEYAAPLYFVSAEQVNVQVPWELRDRTSAWVTVIRDGIAGDPIEVMMEPFRAGIFDVSGLGPIVINSSTGALVSADAPAADGDGLVVFATGLGPAAPALVTGAPASDKVLSYATFPVRAIVTGGGRSVTVQPSFAGAAPEFVGVTQVNFVVNGSLPRGQVTLRLESAGVGATQDVTIYIQ